MVRVKVEVRKKRKTAMLSKIGEEREKATEKDATSIESEEEMQARAEDWREASREVGE